MQFIETSLNQHLLLQDSYFENQELNIDSLIYKFIETQDFDEKKRLIVLATIAIEKFHSYFHFEQSFFHLKYAEHLQEFGEVYSAIEQYKFAIFQDHLNISAHQGLIESLAENSPEKIEALEYAKNLGVNLQDPIPEYRRQFNSYIEYIIFATGSSKKFIRQLDLDNEIYYEKFDLRDAGDIIEDISYRHKQYHKNAAIIYLNYFLLLEDSGEIEIAKNALIKSKNLDPSVVS